MHNTYLSDRTQADINGQVARVLRDLGHPQPPLRLEEVRELLRLDRQHYSSRDDGAIRDWVHKLKMSGKQILLRPMLMVDVIKKFSLTAFYLPDKKRILIDSELPQTKQRWGEGHEIGHSIIPWHDGLMLGDSKQTLSVQCHAQLEAEANYAAGQLLFLQDQFAERLLSTPLSLDAIKVISRDFGNSLTTTLWRAVEQIETPCVGFVSQHPMRPGPDFDRANPCRYLIRSRAFLQRFAHLSERQLFGVTRRYCANRRAGPLGSTEVLVPDSANDNHIFIFETFYNGYDALTLGRYEAKKTASACVA